MSRARRTDRTDAPAKPTGMSRRLRLMAAGAGAGILAAGIFGASAGHDGIFSEAGGIFGAQPSGIFQASGIFGAQPSGIFQAGGIFGAQPSGIFQASGIFGAQPSGIFTAQD